MNIDTEKYLILLAKKDGDGEVIDEYSFHVHGVDSYDEVKEEEEGDHNCLRNELVNVDQFDLDLRADVMRSIRRRNCTKHKKAR